MTSHTSCLPASRFYHTPLPLSLPLLSSLLRPSWCATSWAPFTQCTMDGTVQTRVVAVDAESMSDSDLEEAAALLRSGEPVAFPTETVYGLGANAYDSAAVARIYAAKGRPSDNPLIVHVSDAAMLPALAADVCDAAARLAARFWPGPLTLVLPRTPAVPDAVTAGLGTVGVRVPAHPVARRLIALAGVPVAAPSANVSGRPSPTLARHVLEDLGGRVRLIVDGGACACGLESTVVDPQTLTVLRPGGVTLEQLREVVPQVRLFSNLAATDAAPLLAQPPTPGLKYRHYCPRAAVVLVRPGACAARCVAAARTALDEGRAGGLAVALVRTHRDWEYGPQALAGVTVRCLGGEAGELAAVERGLFAVLRELDALAIDRIVVEGVLPHHEGLAVMNRLEKAASQIVTP